MLLIGSIDLTGLAIGHKRRRGDHRDLDRYQRPTIVGSLTELGTKEPRMKMLCQRTWLETTESKTTHRAVYPVASESNGRNTALP